MRFMSCADDPPPVRIRRRRQLQRRVSYAAAGAIFLAGGAFGAWYVEHGGRLPAIVAETEGHIAALGARLNLTVESVELEGRMRADRQAIFAALEVHRGMPILAVGLDAAKTRLEAVPWVRSASIERLLPDTLYVRIVERRPLALWQHGSKFDLVDQDGAIIANADPAAFSALPQVVGDDAPAATPGLLELLAAEPALQRRVTAAVRVGGRRWNIEFDDGIEVALPENGTSAAWHRLASLERSDGLLERNVQAVDMRLPDRLVMRLAPDVAKSLIKKSRSPQASPNT
ncbi:MAG TPA: cell division protein FtsQ/DivIB [Stellaceae bacterium]|jgi:cell division protein FtsQ